MHGWSCQTVAQRCPPSVDFHTPPPAEPAYQVVGPATVGSTQARARMRPEMLRGPSEVQLWRVVAAAPSVAAAGRLPRGPAAMRGVAVRPESWTSGTPSSSSGATTAGPRKDAARARISSCSGSTAPARPPR